MRTRAEKKVQIAIDKMIDLQEDLCDDQSGTIERILEKLRDLEGKVINANYVNGRLKV